MMNIIQIIEFIKDDTDNKPYSQLKKSILKRRVKFFSKHVFI